MFRRTKNTLPFALAAFFIGFLLLYWISNTQEDVISSDLTFLNVVAVNERDVSELVSATEEPQRSYHFLVFLIPTTPDKVEHRQLLRSTWMNMSAWPEGEFSGIDPRFLDFKIMFVVGRVKGKDTSPQFKAEMSLHDDIYVVDYLFEDLSVLKYKVLWGLFRSLHLFDYNYLVKVDMDTLVMLPDVLKGLSSRSPDQMVYSGTCYGILPTSETERFSPGLVANYHNHRYCFGGGYFLSRDLVQHISELESSVFVTVVDAEDWFVGWLVYHVRKKLGINTNDVQLEKNKDMYMKNEGYHRYNFHETWFLHFLRTPQKLIDAFSCRKGVDNAACPEQVYWHYDNNGTCVCYMKS